jgi:hypothetical protein
MDACGNPAITRTQIITVNDDTKPVLYGVPAHITLECDGAIPTPPTVTATDNCVTNPTVVYSQVPATLNAGFCGIITRTWTATDACGNKKSASQIITVKCCPTICTYTQGFYGNKNGKACTPAGPQVTSLTIMQNALTAAGGSKDFGIVNANNRYFKLINADLTGTNPNIYKMLPGGGTPSTIAAGSVFTSYGNTSTWPRVPIQSTTPGYGSINNTILSQTMALFFNLNMDNTLGNFQLLATGIITSPKASCGSTYPLAIKDTFYIPQNVVDYLTGTGAATVTGLYNLANQYLGGFTVTDISISDINQALDAINRGFDKCRAFRDYYTPPVTSQRMIITSNSTSVEPKKSTSVEPKQPEALIPGVLKVAAYPNPFNSVVNFRIVSPVSGQANLELYDMVGRRLAVVYTGRIDANSPRTITYTMPVVHQSLIVYKFTINGKTVVGNLISSDGNSINKP